jgi:hypothetical protein
MVMQCGITLPIVSRAPARHYLAKNASRLRSRTSEGGLSQRFQLLPAPTTAQKQLFGGTAAKRRSFRDRLTDPTLGNRASQISLQGRALAFEADMETKT